MIMQKEKFHTFSITAVNEEGVLARMLAMFAARAYNVESITAAEIDHQSHLSRITLVTSGTPAKIEQIKAQIDRIVAVQAVYDLTTSGEFVEREMALVKLNTSQSAHPDAQIFLNAAGAKTVAATSDITIYEISGAPDEVDQFMDDIKPFGFIDSCRGGVVAIDRSAVSAFSQSSKTQTKKAS